jgi:uncharacterized protein
MPKSIITVKAIYKLVYVTLFVFLLTVLLFERSAAQALLQEDVSFSSADGVILQGTVIAPQTDHARHPGIVMLSGAGPTTRAELQNEAEAFARRGIVVLIYDKRTIGYSMIKKDFSLLADDALAAVKVLKERSDVSPDQVGIWGLSEGAWVAALAASRSTDVAFVVTAGAVGMSPLRQQTWAYGEYLHHAGVTGWLYRTMQVRGMYLVKGLGLFATADYDGAPVWEQVSQPVLAVWGTLDHEVAPEESVQIIREALVRGGNKHYTIRFIPGVRHNLNNTHNGGFDRIDSIPEVYGEVESAWIKGLATGLPEINVEQAPPQERYTQPLPEPTWYDATVLQLSALGLLIATFGSYPVSAFIRRLRKHHSAPPAKWWSRLLAAAGLTTVIGFTIYFLFLLITAANIIGPMFLSQPLPWFILRVLAGITVLSAAVIAGLLWKRRINMERAHQVRFGLLIAGMIIFVPWAIYWGLLV